MTDTKVLPKPFELGMWPELFETQSILLSASVPYKREPTDIFEDYVRRSHPDRIREAIDNLCRFSFSRDVNLVFGAHPAISPLVLSAARRFGREARRRVVIFQSLYFFDKAPKPTLDLADQQYGTLLWTAACPPDAPNREASLTWMREVMVRSPKLIGAVFIGGMDGVEEEAALFQEWNPVKPMFAIASTGAAAADLLARKAKFRAKGLLCSFFEKNADSTTLEYNLSYPIVMQRIFADLKV